MEGTRLNHDMKVIQIKSPSLDDRLLGMDREKRSRRRPQNQAGAQYQYWGVDQELGYNAGIKYSF